MALLTEKHPHRDFFVPDVFGDLPFKNDMASMQYPVFTLSKNKVFRNLEYRTEDFSITVAPSTYGLPTIYDKDVLLYCGSLVMAEINAGRIPKKTLRVSCHDLLVATNRRTSGEGYRLLKLALDRLQGVSIKTNVKTNKREITKAFGVIESYEIIESSRVKDRMVRLEITLSDWFYNSMIGNEILTINRDYFLLHKPMERRIYEIVRKFCGNSPKWEIGLIKLMAKTGSMDTLRKFRSRLKIIAADNHLPDYSLSLDENDKVTFKKKQIAFDLFNPPKLDHGQLKRLKPETIKLARRLVRDAGTGWAFDAVVSEWSDYMEKTGNPSNINGAMIGFVKKKVATAP